MGCTEAVRGCLRRTAATLRRRAPVDTPTLRAKYPEWFTFPYKICRSSRDSVGTPKATIALAGRRHTSWASFTDESSFKCNPREVEPSIHPTSIKPWANAAFAVTDCHFLRRRWPSVRREVAHARGGHRVRAHRPHRHFFSLPFPRPLPFFWLTWE